MRAVAMLAGKTGEVSIRTRSFDRVMHAQALVHDGPGAVSIRTRSFDRVMHVSARAVWMASAFQSAPGLSTG